jgi:hypothetical protein
MKDIQVIDDFFPEYIQDQIENLILESNIRYKYNPSTFDPIYAPPDPNKEFQEGAQLVNPFIEGGNLLLNDMSHFFLLPFQIACLKLKIKFNFNQLFRAKINLKFKQQSEKDKFINPPHIDIPSNSLNSIIGIYYINNSDGDTVVYKGDNKGILTPTQNISPKKGRILLMDGNLYHSASHPLKTETRIVINYNLIL